MKDKVEERLLVQEFKDQLKELEDEGVSPKDIPKYMKPQTKKMPKKPEETVVIEDVQTGEVLKREPDADDEEPVVTAAILASSHKVRNKGIKRVLSLAQRIQEKKKEGTWIGQDPLPGWASNALGDTAASSAEQPAKWQKSDYWQQRHGKYPWRQ
eukprot:Skav221628  [mRNA]  locus=scaffold2627:444:908:- [translate_table: standard]